MDLDVNVFTDLIKKLKPLETGYVMFVTPEGLVAGHPDTSLFTRNIDVPVVIG